MRTGKSTFWVVVLLAAVACGPSPTAAPATAIAPTAAVIATTAPTSEQATSAASATPQVAVSATTASPTTASPTAASPTTASPTTASPTAASPTTASPTTASPTAASPTAADITPAAVNTVGAGEVVKLSGNSFTTSDPLGFKADTTLEVTWNYTGTSPFALWLLNVSDIVTDPKYDRILVVDVSGPHSGTAKVGIIAGDWAVQVEQAEGPWTVEVKSP